MEGPRRYCLHRFDYPLGVKWRHTVTIWMETKSTLNWVLLLTDHLSRIKLKAKRPIPIREKRLIEEGHWTRFRVRWKCFTDGIPLNLYQPITVTFNGGLLLHVLLLIKFSPSNTISFLSFTLFHYLFIKAIIKPRRIWTNIQRTF